MKIKFEKNNSVIEIVLSDEPSISKGMRCYSHKYEIKSFTIDGEEMGGGVNKDRYFSYNFEWYTNRDEKVYCLYMEYDLAEKVSVKLGLEKTDRLTLKLNEEITRLFTEELIPKAEAMIEEARKKDIEEIKEADRNIADDSEVIVYISGRKFNVVIKGTSTDSFLRRKFEEKLNIYDDESILKKFPYEIGSGYTTDYNMTFKELKELTASIEDEVKMKQAELDRIEKEKEEAEARRREEQIKYDNSHKIVKQVNLIYPQGGEGGISGYYRVIIKESETGEEFDVVLRNVFDAGCWADIYGKTREDKLTEGEHKACKWVYDHAPFSTSIRM